MRTISCANPKGGVGKTTVATVIATTIATYEAERPIRVKVIDADPAENVVLWAHQRQEAGLAPLFEVISGVTADNMVSTIDAIREAGDTDFLIIDLEGTADQIAGFAVARSNLTIIPLSPSSMDARLAARASGLVARMASVVNAPLNYVFAFCRTNAAIMTREHKKIIDQLRDNEQPVLDVDLKERSAFREMFPLGLAVSEMPENKTGQIAKATDNAYEFTQCVIDFMVASEGRKEAA